MYEIIFKVAYSLISLIGGDYPSVDAKIQRRSYIAN